MLNRLFAVLFVAMIALAGCSQPAEESAETPESEAAAEGSASAVKEAIEEEVEAAMSEEEAPVADESSVAESVTLPEALADLVKVSDDFTITKVDVLNADTLQYHIEASTKLDVDKVQAYFIEYYEGKGWTEDMNMSQKGNTVTSYKNEDGFLIFIEANKGGAGSEVTMNTGTV